MYNTLYGNILYKEVAKMSDVGVNIRKRREELGLTQEELAKRLGYKSKSTINKIELGINDVSQTKLKAIADALETAPGELLGMDFIFDAFSGKGYNDGNDIITEITNKAINEYTDDIDAYYKTKETRRIAQEIYNNKELSLLFDAAKDASPEDLQTVHTMLMALKKKENNED